MRWVFVLQVAAIVGLVLGLYLRSLQPLPDYHPRPTPTVYAR